MKNKTTITAIIIFITLLLLVLFITDNKPKTKKNSKDVEILITKQPIEIIPKIKTQKNNSFIIFIRNSLVNELNKKRKYLHQVIDAHEVEISDICREFLYYYDDFEYYINLPKAFLRRVIFMPTFSGNRLFDENDNLYNKPINYSDNDYRSIKFRVSLVPNTIEKLKNIVDFFFNKILISLGFSTNISSQ